MSDPPPPEAPVPFAAALRFWWRLGWISFGGPAAQIALMHEELVVRRRWLSGERFDHGLDVCMLLPGPEAQQLATYTGWLLHGARGGLAAGILFVLPGALLLFVLSWMHAAWGSLRFVDGVLWGLKAVVVALVLEAVLRIGRRALRSPWHAALAVAAFVLLHVLAVPFPLIVAGAALAGLLLPAARTSPNGNGGLAEPAPASPRRLLARTARVLAVTAVLWCAPLLALRLAGEPVQLATQQYLFFTGTAFVTFGGAYAVLAHVMQAAVDTLGWLTPVQAIDGMALAETTPGPLILVLQYVGFVAGWNHPGSLSPLGAAALGAAVTTWTTFVPSTFCILVVAPWVEALRRRRTVSRALAGVTAAVLGVIVHLAVVFGGTVLWPRAGLGGVDVAALVLTIAAFAALASRKAGLFAVIAAGSAIGALRALLG